MMGCGGGECKSTTGAAVGGAMGDDTWHKASEAVAAVAATS